MTIEKRILSAALAKRGDYELLRETLGPDSPWKTLSPYAKAVAEILEDFYSRDPSAGNCSQEIVLDRCQKKASNPHLVEALTHFVATLDGSVSVPNLVDDIRQYQRYACGDKIAGLLANRADPSEVIPLIEEYTSLAVDTGHISTDDDVFTNVGVEELLFRHFDGGETISLGLAGLDKLCDGGARRGHHVLVFARPEIGKTLYTLDMVSSFLQQDLSVLYVGNEDPLSDICLRLYGRLSRRTREEIREDPRGTQDILDSRNIGGFVGYSASPGTYSEIQRLCARHEPDVVVLDQLRNINVGDDNRVTALEKAAIGARNLAKSSGVLLVSVTQAGESAEGKSHLELSDIDFSKTGIPGAIDLAIGIGATEEDKRYGFRQINLPKNKLGGKHDSFTVRFDTRTGVVEEVER